MESFSALSSVNDTLIPILWFEEGIDELGEFWLYGFQCTKLKSTTTECDFLYECDPRAI